MEVYDKPIRTTKDGYKIYNAWYEYKTYEYVENKDGLIVGAKGKGKKELWVLTDCTSCFVHLVPMKSKDLIAGCSSCCDGCEAYKGHTAVY